jgi:hypothetical protein
MTVVQTCIKHQNDEQNFHYFSFALMSPFKKRFSNCVGRDISVDIAIRYGLDGVGIESRWERDFPQPSRPALGPTQPPVQWVPGLSRGQSGRGVGLATPSPSSAEANERAQLYLYSLLGLNGLCRVAFSNCVVTYAWKNH